MKTLIVYEMVPEETKFFVVEGDKRYLDGKFVNSTDELSEEVLNELSEPKWGDELNTPLALEGIGFVVHCGVFL